MPERHLEVLLVEDDEGDVLITREALTEGGVASRLTVVNDGAEAVAYLRGRTPHTGARRPDLVLLDLNLPRTHGHEVLADIKGDADLRRIPVVVLSTSAAEEDVTRAYDLHANAYVTKPVDFDRFVDLVRRIDDFFVSVVQLPREPGLA